MCGRSPNWTKYVTFAGEKTWRGAIPKYHCPSIKCQATNIQTIILLKDFPSFSGYHLFHSSTRRKLDRDCSDPCVVSRTPGLDTGQVGEVRPQDTDGGTRSYNTGTLHLTGIFCL